METRAYRRVFPQLFRVLPNFHDECFYNLIETQKAQEKKNHLTVYLCKLSLLAPSFRQQLVLVLCFYRVMEVRLLARAVLQDVF